MLPYVDVHTHLTHDAFVSDWRSVIHRAELAGLKAIVVNGLEPTSNRAILNMAAEFPVIKPALGIYPLDAVCHQLPSDFKLARPIFDVDREINFIKEQAAAGKLAAVGECGIDAYWIGEETFPEQERVFVSLIEIANIFDLPVIVHSRKREQRTLDILRHYRAKRVDMHCFGGRVQSAVDAAEKDGFYFSIPVNAEKNEAFQKMLKRLPLEQILTETDAPYLGIERGARNEPVYVQRTVALGAKLRQMDEGNFAECVFKNYLRLFES